jgi:hypothetical protein
LNEVRENINDVIVAGVSLKPFQNCTQRYSYASKYHKSHTIKRKHKSRNVRDAEKRT